MLIRRERGFTLIELIIAVAVIGILVTIAMPTYQEFIQRGRRADAQAFMMEVGARQQHWLVDRRAYAGTIAALGVTPPAGLSNFYLVEMDPPVNTGTAPPTFEIVATPIGAQASDKCGVLRLDQAGTKRADGVGSCW